MFTYSIPGYDADRKAIVQRSDGARIFPNGTGWDDFLSWNVQQPNPLDWATLGPNVARKVRPLLDIITALDALTGTQKTAIWNDLNGGSPPKWSLDVGPNAAAIAVLQTFTAMSNFTAANLLVIKLRGTAMYCQDNPNYLVNPVFDPTINVSGDQAA